MNILAVGAHFDDIELGCGGSLAKHIGNGDKVIMYVATTSGFSGSGNTIIRTNEIARKEGEDAANYLGASLVCGNFKTLFLEYNDDLNFQLVQLIEKEKIDLIYTHYVGDAHHDHHALAQACIHAGRHVPRILAYRSNWYQSAVNFSPNFYVDISDDWYVKENLIKLHKSEYGRQGEKWLQFFQNDAINNGFICGVKYAEAFIAVKWLVE